MINLSIWTILSGLSLATWLYLILFHGRYWWSDVHIESDLPDPPEWPSVAVIVPAHNEDDLIEDTLPPLLDQSYPGDYTVVLVDDRSTDQTREVAEQLNQNHSDGRLHVVAGDERPPGWTGKLWALHQGVQYLDDTGKTPRYLTFTDADIDHSNDSIKQMVRKAEQGGYHLVSLMVKLTCNNAWARLLIPAYIYFFQQLYPFAWVNQPDRSLAAAAGGCMLVRASTLKQAGTLEEIHDRMIDDVELAYLIKSEGPIWLGLTTDQTSIRGYDGLKDIWHMVTRTAYEQLQHSILLLLGTVLAMTGVYMVPPVMVFTTSLHGSIPAAVAGGLTWLLMSVSYYPTLKLYRQPKIYSLFLPLIALIYTLMTVDSAIQHWTGRDPLGNRW